jgi:hypothetical protein
LKYSSHALGKARADGCENAIENDFCHDGILNICSRSNRFWSDLSTENCSRDLEQHPTVSQKAIALFSEVAIEAKSRAEVLAVVDSLGPKRIGIYATLITGKTFAHTVAKLLLDIGSLPWKLASFQVDFSVDFFETKIE